MRYPGPQVLILDHVSTDDTRPLASRRPRPRAPGRDRHRPHPARRAPAPGGPGRPLRRQPHPGARGPAPAAGDRPGRPARPPRRGRAPVLSPEECRNVYLVRAELEGLAAERSSGRLTGYDKADLEVAQALLRTGYERHGALAAGDDSRARDPLRAVVTGERAVPQRDPRRRVLPAAARHRAVAPERRPALDRVADVRRRPGHHPPQRRRHTTASSRRWSSRDARRARRLLHAHVVETGETAARWLERQRLAEVSPEPAGDQPGGRRRRTSRSPERLAICTTVPVCGAWMIMPPPM